MKTSPSRSLTLKREVMDGAAMGRIVRRMAGELLERHRELDHLLLVGIHTRGVPLAERLAAEIQRMEGVTPRRGTIDITFYRDDISRIGPQPVVKETQIPSPIDPFVVVLCDDVLYTGRTVRAALDELNDYGRPRAVRLAVLVDRGHRELPIQADVVGKVVPTARSEVVTVGFESVDGADFVRIHEMTEPEGRA
jgi:pyrimidine operon attenuation protein/uracil phosphoribosyltransferase